MPESYRLFILKKLCDLLGGITLANGYEYDLECKVYRGRMVFGETDSLPMLSIIESTSPPGGLPVGMQDQARKGEWPLFVQGWVENDSTQPSDAAYNLMAAVEHRLARIVERTTTGKPASDDYMLGLRPETNKPNLATFRMGPGVVRPPANQVSSEAFFFLPIWVGLVEEVGQPYVTKPSI